MTPKEIVEKYLDAEPMYFTDTTVDLRPTYRYLTSKLLESVIEMVEKQRGIHLSDNPFNPQHQLEVEAYNKKVDHRNKVLSELKSSLQSELESIKELK